MQETQEINPYSLFLFSLKSRESRLKYTQRINRFFDFIEISQGDAAVRCKVFLQNGHDDSNYVLNCVILFLQAQKEKVESKELASGTVRNYVNTIKLLCEVCEFQIPWKKILRGMPRGRRFASDRAPTIEEIRKIIEYPDRRITCIVFVMASSGIRLGAWDYLKWGHIKPVFENGEVSAAKVRVYAEEDEEYLTFITAEAYSSILDWMNFRKESGESINDESWVLRNLWDLESRGQGIASVPKRLKSSGVKRLMERAQHAQGVRKKLENGKKRHEFQLDHGFRKWFKTQCEIAGMKSINIETLMGHSIGVSDSYYRATEHDLLKDYKKAIDFLTIRAEHLLQKEVQELSHKTDQESYAIKGRLAEKDKEISVLRQRDAINSDAISALSDKLHYVVSEIENLKRRH